MREPRITNASNHPLVLWYRQYRWWIALVTALIVTIALNA